MIDYVKSVLREAVKSGAEELSTAIVQKLVKEKHSIFLTQSQVNLFLTVVYLVKYLESTNSSVRFNPQTEELLECIDSSGERIARNIKESGFTLKELNTLEYQHTLYAFYSLNSEEFKVYSKILKDHLASKRLARLGLKPKRPTMSKEQSQLFTYWVRYGNKNKYSIRHAGVRELHVSSLPIELMSRLYERKYDSLIESEEHDLELLKEIYLCKATFIERLFELGLFLELPVFIELLADYTLTFDLLCSKFSLEEVLELLVKSLELDVHYSKWCTYFQNSSEYKDMPIEWWSKLV